VSSRRHWIVAEPQRGAAALARELALPAVVGQVLINRGVAETDAATRFLDPRLRELRDPGDLADVDLAVTRLIRALEGGETIGVFGDYDVDGVTSTALMSWALEQMGARVVRHIPHRLLEGYGLGTVGLQTLAEQGATLVVAVDCGTTAHEEIAQATAQGMDVIVVDHHALGPTLPPAVAVLNPHREDCQFGFRDLAAVGVTFFLCAALRRALRETGRFSAETELDLRDGLDLVALGTVADQVPLVDKNRVLVTAGLKALRRAHRVGIVALCDVAGLAPRRLQASHIAFQLGPRINAAGRLGDAMAAVDLLLTEDPLDARALANVLDTANHERRRIEQVVFEQASQQLDAYDPAALPSVLVLASEAWHPGVVGIVASRMVERYARPAILVGAEGRGSGRSVPGFNLHLALGAAEAHLRRYGGHAQAVGVRIASGAEVGLRAALASYADEHLPGALLQKTLPIDARVPVRDLDLPLAEALQELGPFGQGNPEPLFCLDGVHFRSQQTVGSRHVRFVVEEAGHRVGGIAFGMAERLAAGDFADGARLAVVPEIDDWGTSRRLSLRAVDIIGPGDDKSAES